MIVFLWVLPANAKYAELSYELVDKAQTISLIKISLKTGRHHQIRAQLSSRGIHILNDVKYGANPFFSECATQKGIALAAYRLQYQDLNTGKIRTIETDLDNVEFFKDFYKDS